MQNYYFAFMVFTPLEQFEIFPLIGLRFGSFDLSFTNSSLIMLVSIIFFSSIVTSSVGPKSGLLIPSRWQLIVESI